MPTMSTSQAHLAADDGHLHATSSRKTKADDLARTRRNQQRCRDRKRAHVSELEAQVTALQAKIRQCEPCGTPVSMQQETALETAQRENSARRDLLLALGFDEQTQQRFIESEAKRQAVFTVLSGEDQQPNGNVASAHSGSQGLTTDHDNGIFDLNEWLMSTESLPEQMHLPMLLDDDGGDPHDMRALSKDRTIQASLPPITSSAPAAPHSHAVEGPTPPQMQDAATSPKHIGETTGPVNGKAARCFLDTALRFDNAETTTPCSEALPLLFRYNERGLPTSELQRRLEIGIQSSTCSAECRIENKILFKVLADITST